MSLDRCSMVGAAEMCLSGYSAVDGDWLKYVQKHKHVLKLRSRLKTFRILFHFISLKVFWFTFFKLEESNDINNIKQND